MRPNPQVDMKSIYSSSAVLRCPWAQVQSTAPSIAELDKSGQLIKKIKGKIGGSIKWHQRTAEVKNGVFACKKGSTVQCELLLKDCEIEPETVKARPFCFKIHAGLGEDFIFDCENYNE